MIKASGISYALLGLSACAYVALAYFIPKGNFTQLLLLYTLLFACYVYIINQKIATRHGIVAAILLRLLFLFATPAFIHRFEFPDHHSLYPPLAQAIGWLATRTTAYTPAGDIILMRIVVLLAETGSIWLLLRLVRKTALSDKHVFLYALNPLVILELAGNLHLEALMIFFLLLTLYLLTYQRCLAAGISFGAAVATKFLPLLLLPFILSRIGTRNFLLFSVALLGSLLLFFSPLLLQHSLQDLLSGWRFYLQAPAFNASFYYLLRWMLKLFTDAGHVQAVGPILAFISFVSILSLAKVKKLSSVRRMVGYMAAAVTIYLLLSSAVQPWHITPLIALTAISHFRYAVVWSGLIILAYAAPGRHEDITLVIVEYALVFLWLFVELYLYRRHQWHHNLKD
ncbi:hypothetical protein [Pontibacter sp. SGAir0037]|uniref:hypothetical protein n=1 Tax=Pontibacter sp. SGAir0037 TaxID=2571030 RepID=UPI0010CD4AEC|nr:hypothetical protein [Pontibacter sp. SGAir0037]QCR23129.1 hypothetical protein C1N53_12745 [Pontibacter sp. SGAir0037]